jgi:hypothetical protein
MYVTFICRQFAAYNVATDDKTELTTQIHRYLEIDIRLRIPDVRYSTSDIQYFA